MVVCCWGELINWPGKCFKNISRKKRRWKKRDYCIIFHSSIFFIVEKAVAVNDDTQLDILKAVEFVKKAWVSASSSSPSHRVDTTELTCG